MDYSFKDIPRTQCPVDDRQLVRKDHGMALQRPTTINNPYPFKLVRSLTTVRMQERNLGVSRCIPELS